MKDYISRKGAVGALLDEYERSLDELRNMVSDVSEEELIRIVDEQTKDENCRSVQTILTHVVNSGYYYATVIQKLKDQNIPIREKIPRNNIREYHNDIDKVFEFTAGVLRQFTDAEIEEYDNSRKILTRWDQRYDIEQMMEHAIVHIMRHRRQIEKFKIKLRPK